MLEIELLFLTTAKPCRNSELEKGCWPQFDFVGPKSWRYLRRLVFPCRLSLSTVSHFGIWVVVTTCRPLGSGVWTILGQRFCNFEQRVHEFSMQWTCIYICRTWNTKIVIEKAIICFTLGLFACPILVKKVNYVTLIVTCVALWHWKDGDSVLPIFIWSIFLLLILMNLLRQCLLGQNELLSFSSKLISFIFSFSN